MLPSAAGRPAISRRSSSSNCCGSRDRCSGCSNCCCSCYICSRARGDLPQQRHGKQPDSTARVAGVAATAAAATAAGTVGRRSHAAAVTPHCSSITIREKLGEPRSSIRPQQQRSSQCSRSSALALLLPGLLRFYCCCSRRTIGCELDEIDLGKSKKLKISRSRVEGTVAPAAAAVVAGLQPHGGPPGGPLRLHKRSQYASILPLFQQIHIP